MRGRFWLILAGLFGGTAVAIGAFHAHGLATVLEKAELEPAEIERRLGFVETAYQYQLWHALALLGIGVFIRTWPASTPGKIAAVLMSLGIVLFCGSLYGLAYGDADWLGRIAPAGGLTLMAAWAMLALTGWLAPEPEIP